MTYKVSSGALNLCSLTHLSWVRRSTTVQRKLSGISSTVPEPSLYWLQPDLDSRLICRRRRRRYTRTSQFYSVYRVFRKNDTKFAAPHFCNHTSQSRAVFKKCPEISCLHDKGQRLNAAVKYSLFCGCQVKTKLSATSF